MFHILLRECHKAFDSFIPHILKVFLLPSAVLNPRSHVPPHIWTVFQYWCVNFILFCINKIKSFRIVSRVIAAVDVFVKRMPFEFWRSDVFVKRWRPVDRLSIVIIKRWRSVAWRQYVFGGKLWCGRWRWLVRKCNKINVFVASDKLIWWVLASCHVWSFPMLYFFEPWRLVNSPLPP